MSSRALSASADALAPVRAALAAMARQPDVPPPNGLAPDLVVTDTVTWTPASALASGAAVDHLLATAALRWRAAPHAAAALAWKCYSYWAALPAVLGYASARRVPLVRAGAMLARWSPRQPFLTVGLRSDIVVAVLPSDPLAVLPANGSSAITVVPDEAALLAALRTALLDEHLDPIVTQLQQRVNVGRRTLWGSLASGVAHGLSRAADSLPGPTLATAHELLLSLGVADLVELRPAGARLSVQRRTCCLAFTLPEPKICTGCCIR